MIHEDEKLVKRFEDKWVPITEVGCWIWTAGCHERGYGLFYTGRGLRKGKMEFAHRVSFEIYNKQQPTREDCVCHTCDNPYYVNPDHLFLGTHRENMEDMKSKKRFVSSKQRLSEEDVEKAILMRSEGLPLKEIGESFGISPSHASRITRGLRKHFNQ